MAFMVNKVFDLQGIVAVVLSAILLVESTNIDCNGKPFHCINSTHFMICVDLGGGLSSTVDNFVIPCPPTTVCNGINRFECEFAPIPPKLDVITTDSGQHVDISATTSIVEVITTEIPIMGFEENLNTISTIAESENETARKPGEILSNQIEIQEDDSLTVSTPTNNGFNRYPLLDATISKEPSYQNPDRNSDIIANSVSHGEGTETITEHIVTQKNNDFIPTVAWQITTDPPLELLSTVDVNYSTISSETKSTNTDIITTNAHNNVLPYTVTLEPLIHDTNSAIMTSTESVFYENVTEISTEIPITKEASESTLSFETNLSTTVYKETEQNSTTKNYYESITTDNLSNNNYTNDAINAVSETLTTRSEFINNNEISTTEVGSTLHNNNFIATTPIIITTQFVENITEILTPGADITNQSNIFTTIPSLPSTHFEYFEPNNGEVINTDAINTPTLTDNFNDINNSETALNATETTSTIFVTENNIVSDTGVIYDQYVAPTTEGLFPSLKENADVNQLVSEIINIEASTYVPKTDVDSFSLIVPITETTSTADIATEVSKMNTALNSVTSQDKFSISSTTSNTEVNVVTENMQELYLTSTDMISKKVPETFINAVTDSTNVQTESILIINNPEESVNTLQYQLQNSTLDISIPNNTGQINDFISTSSEKITGAINDTTKNNDLNNQDSRTPLEVTLSSLQNTVQDKYFSSVDKTTQINIMESLSHIKQTEPTIPRTVSMLENHIIPHHTTEEPFLIITEDPITSTLFPAIKSHQENPLESLSPYNDQQHMSVQSVELSKQSLSTVTEPNLIETNLEINSLLPNPTTESFQITFPKQINPVIDEEKENYVPVIFNDRNSSIQIDSPINSMALSEDMKNSIGIVHETNTSNFLSVNNSGMNTDEILNNSVLAFNTSRYQGENKYVQETDTITSTPNIVSISSTMSILSNLKDSGSIKNAENETGLPNISNTFNIKNENIIHVPAISTLNVQHSTTNIVDTLSPPIPHSKIFSLIMPNVTKRGAGDIFKMPANNYEQINNLTRINETQQFKQDPGTGSQTIISSPTREIIDQHGTLHVLSPLAISNWPAPIEQRNPLIDVEEILLPVNAASSQINSDTASNRQSDGNGNIEIATAVIFNNYAPDLTITTKQSKEPLSKPDLVSNKNKNADQNAILNKDPNLEPITTISSDFTNIPDIVDESNRKDTAVESRPMEKYITDTQIKPVSKVNIPEIGTQNNLTKTYIAANISQTVDETNKPYYSCVNHSRGRYADQNDCRKFYICIGNLHPIVGICPNNTVFSEIRKQCTKTLSQCTRNNQFLCASEGRFGDLLQDNVYYICLRNSSNKDNSTNDKYIRYKLRCQNGLYLNQTSFKCVHKVLESSRSLNSNSDTTNSDSTNSYSSSSQSVTVSAQEMKKRPKNKFKCEIEGKFQDPNDCRKYYICYKNRKSILKRKKKECDSDEVFDSETKTCKDSESYECISSH